MSDGVKPGSIDTENDATWRNVLWDDAYMKITWAMLAAVLLPVAIALVFFPPSIASLR